MKTPELTEEKFNELQAAHPGARLSAVTVAGHDIVVKAPPRAEWKRYKTMVLDPAKRVEANATLVMATVVYPPLDVFDLIVNDRPAIIERVWDYVTDLAGASDAVVEKKFGSSSTKPTLT